VSVDPGYIFKKLIHAISKNFTYGVEFLFVFRLVTPCSELDLTHLFIAIINGCFLDRGCPRTPFAPIFVVVSSVC
jgi:hypothetical protein